MEVINAEAGQNIHDAAMWAIIRAKEKFSPVKLIFNDIEIIISPESYVTDITTIYYLRSELRNGGH